MRVRVRIRARIRVSNPVLCGRHSVATLLSKDKYASPDCECGIIGYGDCCNYDLILHIGYNVQ